jgi:hypothetical protein
MAEEHRGLFDGTSFWRYQSARLAGCVAPGAMRLGEVELPEGRY